MIPHIVGATGVSRERPKKSARMTCIAAGILAGRTLFAVVGAITERAVWGGMSGAAIGAVVGWGWCSRLISPAIAWICCFAVAGAFIGPGCDADALSSALWFVAIGAFIGYLRWQGLIILVGGLVAVNLGPLVFGLFTVVTCAYLVGTFLDSLGFLPPDRRAHLTDHQRV